MTWVNLLEVIYSVGSIYTSMSATSPAETVATVGDVLLNSFGGEVVWLG